MSFKRLIKKFRAAFGEKQTRTYDPAALAEQLNAIQRELRDVLTLAGGGARREPKQPRYIGIGADDDFGVIDIDDRDPEKAGLERGCQYYDRVAGRMVYVPLKPQGQSSGRPCQSRHKES